MHLFVRRMKDAHFNPLGCMSVHMATLLIIYTQDNSSSSILDQRSQQAPGKFSKCRDSAGYIITQQIFQQVRVISTKKRYGLGRKST